VLAGLEQGWLPAQVGGAMLVRASEGLPKGAEVTTSYLGELAAAPLSTRRKALHGAYGFSCQCQRCKVGPWLQAALLPRDSLLPLPPPLSHEPWQ
jgi:hypothetical protein